MAASYEDFAADARLTQQFKWVLRQSKNWESLSTMDKDAIEGIVTSLARILNGNAAIVLLWDDIASYALAAARARGLT